PGNPAPTTGPGTSAAELKINVELGRPVEAPVVNDSPVSAGERSPPTDIQVSCMRSTGTDTRSRITVSPPSAGLKGECAVQRPARMRASKSLNSGASGI